MGFGLRIELLRDGATGLRRSSTVRARWCCHQVRPSAEESLRSATPELGIAVFFASSGDTVGVYSNVAKVWIEHSSSSGSVIGRWAGLSMPKTPERGVSMTNSGDVFVVADRKDVASRNNLRELHKLDKAHATWTMLNGVHQRIIGADRSSVCS